MSVAWMGHVQVHGAPEWHRRSSTQLMGLTAGGQSTLNSWVLAADEDVGDAHSLGSVETDKECCRSNQASPVLVLRNLSSTQRLGLPCLQSHLTFDE